MLGEADFTSISQKVTTKSKWARFPFSKEGDIIIFFLNIDNEKIITS